MQSRFYTGGFTLFMKNLTTKIMGTAAVAAVSFGLLAFSCKANNGSANVAFAETKKTSPSVSLPSDSLSVTQALQTTFRSISSGVLPAVVEVDVTEKKTYTDPFQGFASPFEFFFGRPERPDSGNDKKEKQDDGKREYEQKGLGSGVIVRRTGDTLYVLTNNHVAGAATKINIKLNDGRSFEAKLVGSDERIDIALVSFEAKDKTIPVAKLGDSDSVMPGDICMAFGAPLGYAQSVTQGIVSATGRSEAHMSSISDKRDCLALQPI